MLSLEKYLSQSHAPASFGAGLQYLCDCSLFATRLLAKHADLLDDLLQNHAKNYALAQMQQFLQTANIVDEISLKKMGMYSPFSLLIHARIFSLTKSELK